MTCTLASVPLSAAASNNFLVVFTISSKAVVEGFPFESALAYGFPER
jgi:hypothetical protein